MHRLERFAMPLVLTLGTLGVLSLLQGVFDVALPVSRGGAPFSFSFGLMHRLGPGVMFLSIFVHNVGLAAMLPGIGFLAAMLEPNASLRRWIPRILFGAMLASMGSAFLFMFVGSGDFNLRFSLPLFLAEATAVVGVALLTYEHFPRCVERPRRTDVALALGAIGPALFAATLGLLVLAMLETMSIVA